MTKHPRNRIVYTGRVFKVGAKKLVFSGKKVDFHTVLIGRVVAVVPVLDDGRIVMEYNYRNTINQWLYELPAGHVDHGESPQASAKRELEEETGYRAGTMRYLFNGYASPGMSDELLSVFVATKLLKRKSNKEASERIRLRPMTLELAMLMVKSGKVKDLKTVAGLLFYAQYVHRH